MLFENAEHLVYVVTESEVFMAHTQTGLQDIYIFILVAQLVQLVKYFMFYVRISKNQNNPINLYNKALFYAHLFYAFLL